MYNAKKKRRKNVELLLSFPTSLCTGSLVIKGGNQTSSFPVMPDIAGLVPWQCWCRKRPSSSDAHILRVWGEAGRWVQQGQPYQQEQSICLLWSTLEIKKDVLWLAVLSAGCSRLTRTKAGLILLPRERREEGWREQGEGDFGLSW